MPFQVTAVHSTREYEIQSRKHHRGVDLFSDVLPFGHLWHGESKAVSNTIAYAKHRSRSRDAVIPVYALLVNVIETRDYAGEFQEWWRSTAFTGYSARFAVQVSSVRAVRRLSVGRQ
jgi:hypothetical protein